MFVALVLLLTIPKIQGLPKDTCNMVSCPQPGRNKGKNGSGDIRVTRVGSNSKRCSRRLHSEKGLANVCGLHLNLRPILAYSKRGVFSSVSNFCNITAIECYLTKLALSFEPSRSPSRISLSILFARAKDYRLKPE